MFQAFGELFAGKVFWESVVKQWPIPCPLSELGSAVVTTDEGMSGSGKHLMLAVVQSEKLLQDDRIQVQIREPTSVFQIVNVTLAIDGRYVSGTHRDVAVDELGATDALKQYAPFIKGNWKKSPFSN